MKKQWIALVGLLAVVAHSSQVLAAKKLVCEGPTFTDANIIEVVRRAKFVRDDIPMGFDNPEIVIERRRCHYIYKEYAPDHGAGKIVIFTINQYGMIVDAYRGR